MKKIILSCLAICASCYMASAQLTEKQLKLHQKAIDKSKNDESVIWSFDTIFNKGLPYCIMKKKNKKMFGHSDCDFYTLSGKNVFYAKTIEAGVTERYEILFFTTERKAYWSGDVEEGVVEFELFAGDSLNATAVNKFLLLHADKPDEGTVSKIAGQIGLGSLGGRGNDDDDDDAPRATRQPARDRNAKVSIFGDDAQQDFKTIGTIKEVFGGRNMNTVYEIFDAGGRKIAEAEARMHSTTWQVVTLKNNKAHTVTCASFREKEAIMEYLARLRYL
jgi:hypothetical protein